MDAAQSEVQPESNRITDALKARPEEWARRVVGDLLADAGVELDGQEPWCPQIRSPRALARFLVSGTLGAGEAYVDGEWDCDALDELTARLVRRHVEERATKSRFIAAEAIARIANFQTRALAKKSAAAHYDIGNDLYEAMLGRTMAYSCGLWRNADSLDEAQDAKHDLICRKLHLRPGQRVLDIGCGFGSFAKFAAERYGVTVSGVTISRAQAELARTRCAELPVDIQIADYRDVTGSFDRVVSVGMFEHVGPLNYRGYFEKAKSLLAGNGLMLLQSIGATKPSFRTDPWLHRYIFPNCVIPAASQIATAVEGLFHVEDWQNFGPDYDRTLTAWCANFDAAWPLLAERYGEKFRRMWRYYLLTCAGTFRTRRNELFQIVLSNTNVEGTYHRVA